MVANYTLQNVLDGTDFLSLSASNVDMRIREEWRVYRFGKYYVKARSRKRRRVEIRIRGQMTQTQKDNLSKLISKLTQADIDAGKKKKSFYLTGDLAARTRLYDETGTQELLHVIIQDITYRDIGGRPCKYDYDMRLEVISEVA